MDSVEARTRSDNARDWSRTEPRASRLTACAARCVRRRSLGARAQARPRHRCSYETCYGTASAALAAARTRNARRDFLPLSNVHIVTRVGQDDVCVSTQRPSLASQVQCWTALRGVRGRVRRRGSFPQHGAQIDEMARARHTRVVISVDCSASNRLLACAASHALNGSALSTTTDIHFALSACAHPRPRTSHRSTHFETRNIPHWNGLWCWPRLLRECWLVPGPSGSVLKNWYAVIIGIILQNRRADER